MLQAFLAEGVGLDVSVTNAPPLRTIPFRGIIGALVFVVLGVHHLGVFLAVPVVGELGATGKTARLLGLCRHKGLPPFRAITKARMGWLPHRLSFYSFAL